LQVDASAKRAALLNRDSGQKFPHQQRDIRRRKDTDDTVVFGILAGASSRIRAGRAL
jgi:hypothetical protein